MRLEQATQKDFEAIIAFYDDVTERTPDMAVYARWIKGKHPTQESIRTYIDEGSMYLYREEGGIVGAMAVTMYQGEDYHAIEWARQVGDDEVAVIHILAVSPDKQGEGIGSEMIREAIRMALSKGMKAIRLDALASNKPAHRIYERLGFEYRGKQHLYAENTGWTDFYFFEYKNCKTVNEYAPAGDSQPTIPCLSERSSFVRQLDDKLEFVCLEKKQMQLRPFNPDDAETILGWCKDKYSFRLWSADRYKDFPAKPEEMMRQYEGQNLHPLTAISDDIIIGHILLRYPSEDKTVIRFGFVIVDDSKRGKGYGKQMLRLAIDYALLELRAKCITLGVFCDNSSAVECYKSVGFRIIGMDSYVIDGDEWKGFEMELLA